MSVAEMQEKYQNVNDSDLGSAIQALEEIMKFDDATEAGLRLREKAIYRLGKLYQEKGLVDELIDLTKSMLPLFINLPHKSKVAKVVRTLFDMSTKIPGNEKALVDLCNHIIDWARENKRSFLRHRI